MAIRINLWLDGVGTNMIFSRIWDEDCNKSVSPAMCERIEEF